MKDKIAKELIEKFFKERNAKCEFIETTSDVASVMVFSKDLELLITNGRSSDGPSLVCIAQDRIDPVRMGWYSHALEKEFNYKSEISFRVIEEAYISDYDCKQNKTRKLEPGLYSAGSSNCIWNDIGLGVCFIFKMD